MSEATIISIVQKGILTIIFAAAPPLILGLSVGVIVSVFQAVTSIQEPTLAFVPKIVAVFLAIYIFGPWMLTVMRDFLSALLLNMHNYMAH